MGLAGGSPRWTRSSIARSIGMRTTPRVLVHPAVGRQDLRLLPRAASRAERAGRAPDAAREACARGSPRSSARASGPPRWSFFSSDPEEERTSRRRRRSARRPARKRSDSTPRMLTSRLRATRVGRRACSVVRMRERLHEFRIVDGQERALLQLPEEDRQPDAADADRRRRDRASGLEARARGRSARPA